MLQQYFPTGLYFTQISQRNISAREFYKNKSKAYNFYSAHINLELAENQIYFHIYSILCFFPCARFVSRYELFSKLINLDTKSK